VDSIKEIKTRIFSFTRPCKRGASWFYFFYIYIYIYTNFK